MWGSVDFRMTTHYERDREVIDEDQLLPGGKPTRIPRTIYTWSVENLIHLF